MSAGENENVMDEATQALSNLISHADKKLNGDETVSMLMGGVGAIRSLYEMNWEDLHAQHGLSKPVSEAIDLIDDLARCMMRDEFAKGKPIRRADDAQGYFQAVMYGRHVEYCYLMLLDARGKMLSCPMMQRGTIDRSQVYVRELALAALRSKAKYAIMAHNHPGGSLEPSQADVQVTHAAMEAMKTVDVILLDHLIVTGSQYTSIRKCGTPSEKIWLSQMKDDEILKDWLSKDVPSDGGRK